MSLSNYFAILSGEKEAKYLHTKKNKLDFDLRGKENDLWRVHEECESARNPESPLTLLDLKIELGKRILESCRFCERRCGANRADGEPGHCKVLKSKVATEFVHFGEEPEIVPSYTIFFASCTFHCCYCQNWDISQYPNSGIYMHPKVLARMIEGKSRVRNVNWVGGDPTPNLAYVLEVLYHCNRNIPQVWNSNMYLTQESMRLLKQIIDVYLTDFKYGNDKCAKRLSKVDNYFEVCARNHRIANQQGELLIRHLVLPNHLECCTKPVLRWIAENLTGVKVNVMAQYRPEHKAKEQHDIRGYLSREEYTKAVRYAEELGLELVER